MSETEWYSMVFDLQWERSRLAIHWIGKQALIVIWLNDLRRTAGPCRCKVVRWTFCEDRILMAIEWTAAFELI